MACENDVNPLVQSPQHGVIVCHSLLTQSEIEELQITHYSINKSCFIESPFKLLSSEDMMNIYVLPVCELGLYKFVRWQGLLKNIEAI